VQPLLGQGKAIMLINRSKATLGASTTVCFSQYEAEIFQLSFHLLATWTCSPIGRPALPAENVAFSALGNRGQAEGAAGAGDQSQQGLSIQK